MIPMGTQLEKRSVGFEARRPEYSENHPVILVGWASSPSIQWDGQSRVLRGTSPSNRFIFSRLFFKETPMHTY